MKIASAATKDVLYGLLLMYQTLRAESSVEFKAFRDLSQARAWLGLPLEDGDSDSSWKEIGS